MSTNRAVVKPTVAELRGFQRLHHLKRLAAWWSENGVTIEDKGPAFAVLIADAMAVVRARANKKYADLDYPNFMYRASE